MISSQPGCAKTSSSAADAASKASPRQDSVLDFGPPIYFADVGSDSNEAQPSRSDASGTRMHRRFVSIRSEMRMRIVIYRPEREAMPAFRKAECKSRDQFHATTKDKRRPSYHATWTRYHHFLFKVPSLLEQGIRFVERACRADCARGIE